MDASTHRTKIVTTMSHLPARGLNKNENGRVTIPESILIYLKIQSASFGCMQGFAILFLISP